MDSFKGDTQNFPAVHMRIGESHWSVPRNNHNLRRAGCIVGPRFARTGSLTVLDAVLIEEMLDNAEGRPVIPDRVVIEVQTDRGNRSGSDVRAAPPSGCGLELAANLEIRVLHG